MTNLKIYFSTDVHGYIFPTNYVDFQDKNIGVLKFSSLFNKDDSTLIIDGGDTIQGSPFTTYLNKNNDQYSGNPIATIYNKLQYDYVTLGNHDFNYGEEYLINYLHALDAKILCCNIFYTKEPHLIKPYEIKEINGVKIGIIGAATQFINIWERKEHIENFKIINPFEAIRETIDLIKNQVDFTIVIYHGGFERDVKTGELLGSETGENQAYKIAKNLNIDLLLTGHQHLEIYNTTINNTHIVQTIHNAQQVSEITIDFDTKLISSKLITPTTIKENFVTDELHDLERKVQIWLDKPIGHLDEPIIPKSHIEMALNGHPLAHFVNDIQLEIAEADISCTSLANSVKGFNKNITVRDIVSTYIYPNTLVVNEITGKILKLGLERSAEYLDLKDGEIVISDTFLKPKEAHYNYDYFRGIEYTINLKKPVHERIENLTFKGKPVKDDDTFKIVMLNYRATGAGGYEFYKECKLVKEILIEVQDIIIEYILQNPNLTVSKENNYHFIF